MANYVKGSPVELHPQRAQIIEKITDTSRKWTSRQIAATLDPPVAQTTIARFRTKILGNAVKTLRGKTANTHRIRQIAELATADIDPDTIAASLRVELQRALAKDRERRERWISDAENRVVRDKTGAVVNNPATGQPLTNYDHRALAAHDRNGLSATELQAKLGGLMQGETAPVTVNLAILAPSQQGSSSAADAVVDVSAIQR